MACRLFGAKPLSIPMLDYCHLDPWKQILLKFELDTILIQENASENVDCKILAIFILASMCQVYNRGQYVQRFWEGRTHDGRDSCHRLSIWLKFSVWGDNWWYVSPVNVPKNKLLINNHPILPFRFQNLTDLFVLRPNILWKIISRPLSG